MLQERLSGGFNPFAQRIEAAEAARWLETMKYEHQRTIRKHHVEELAEEMRRGKFVPGTQIRIASYQGRMMLVDGQHRLAAVVASGLPQTFTILEVEAKSEAEVAWMYGYTDIGMRRTASDLYSALELTEEFGISRTDVNNLSAAVIFMASGCLRNKSGNSPIHRDDVVSYMRTYAPYMKQYVELIFQCDTRMRNASTRAASLSIALLSLRFSLPYAESRGEPSVVEFWRGVIFDDGIQIGDARKVANRHLLGSTMLGNGIVGAATTPAYSSRYLVKCFQAYMERREIKQTKVFDAQAPIDMHGVPKDRTQWMI
jgi:hypothetical protein